MTFYWIYDIPNWTLGLLSVVVFASLALIGLFATRPLARRMLGGSSAHNDVVSAFFGGIGVFYGLALGLIAVGTWENFTEVDSLVGKEAASLASLYRDFDGYPQPLRQKLERELPKLCAERKIPHHFARVGSMWTLFFTGTPVVDYDTAKTSDAAKFGRFFWAMLDRGVYLPCSQFEAAFLSAAMTSAHIDETLTAARESLDAIAA